MAASWITWYFLTSSRTGGNVDRVQRRGMNLFFTAEKKCAALPIKLNTAIEDFVLPSQFSPHTTGTGRNPRMLKIIS